MLRFQHLEMNVLMDLLSLNTARYTRMMMEGGSQEEFTACRETVEILRKEIEFRNAECDITATPTPPFSQRKS
jgi:hypothetical protein